MYIFWVFFIYYLFFNSVSNAFLYFFILLFLIYFFYVKNLIFFLEAYSFAEDRIIILLENITRVEYNLTFILFFCLIICFILFYQFNTGFLIFFLFCSLNINYFYPLQDFYESLFYCFKFNTKLLNGLFLIHPFVIYIFYALIISFSITFLHLKKNSFILTSFLNKFYFEINFLKILIFIVFLGITAIILGSWWAFQEINWNGWWSWDLIEIINLLLIIYILRFTHSKSISNLATTFNLNNNFLNFLILPVFFMVISRFNLVNSLHSFVLLNNFAQFYFLINYFLFFLFIIFIIENISFFKLLYFKITFFSINFLNFFFYFIFSIFFYKLIYELLIFFFNLQSFLEYFYFYKHYIYFNFLMFNLIIANLNFSYLILILNLLAISFIEIFLFVFLFRIMYIKTFDFFKWHFLVYIFLILNFLNFYSLDYSFKNWTYNFFPIIENFKINYILTKTTLASFVTNVTNSIIPNIDFYSIISSDNAIINYKKSNLYFLSTFNINLNSFSITSYKFFFYYTFVFSKYLSLYYIVFIILSYYFILLKKKLGKLNF